MNEELLTRQVENLSRQISRIRREILAKNMQNERRFRRLEYIFRKEENRKETDMLSIIFQAIEELFGVTPQAISGAKKDRTIMEIRHLFYYATDIYNISRKVAATAAARDHSTVVYGVQVCGDLIQVESIYTERWELLRAEIEKRINNINNENI